MSLISCTTSLVEHAGDRGLELARQVGEGRVADVAALDLLDRRRRVDQLVPGDPGDRGAEDDARAVAAGLGGQQPDGLEPLPDRGHVLDPDPVQLDVLPVGDVGGAAGVVAGHLADDARCSVVRAPPSTRTRSMKYSSSSSCGSSEAVLPPSMPGLALGVEPPPAEPAVQVVAADRGEALLAVDVLDAGPHVEGVVLLLEPLVGVQRLRSRRGPTGPGPPPSGRAGDGRSWQRRQRNRS